MLVVCACRLLWSWVVCAWPCVCNLECLSGCDGQVFFWVLRGVFKEINQGGLTLERVV